MQEDIRWKQRFENFRKALSQLQKAATEVTNPSALEKEGTVQRFEFTHELAWKVMKDFLQSRGVSDIFGSRDATRKAFAEGLLDDGETWMQMIVSRNLTVHTYNESVLEREYEFIVQRYLPLFGRFSARMQSYL